ncbi:lactococcin family bacteriocin, partial [Citrobacter sp. TBCS-11]
MEIQTNFQIISDEELSEIVGGGYPNNQSMNDWDHLPADFQPVKTG